MGEFVNFASGTITDSPLTVGATQINSAAFATVLPVIAAPHVMSIVLDPDGVDGVPEIVNVIAHVAGATAVTVIRGQQTSLGGNVARAHAAGTSWVLAATAVDLNRTAGDPGDLKAGIWSSPPDGWLLMGQSISGADVTYPNLWAVVPAAWKAAGGILNLPNMDGRVLMGGSGTLGAVGGANSHTLDVNRLAPHTHTIDHDHPGIATGPVSADHTHYIQFQSQGRSADHTHTVHATGLTDMQGLHAHNSAYINHTALAAGSAMGIDRSMDAAPPAGGYMNLGTDTQGHHNHNVTVDGVTGGESVDHSHGVVGSTQGISANHYHVVDLPNYTGSSGNAGSGSVIDHTPSNLRINVAIKT